MRRLPRLIARLRRPRRGGDDHLAALRLDIAGLTTRLDGLTERLAEHGTFVGGHGKALAEHGQWLAEHSTALGQHGKAFDEMSTWVTRLEQTLSDLTESYAPAEHRELRGRIDELERAPSVSVFMHWIEHARLRTTPRVSVITPTRNRAAFLALAVESVRAQTYPHWEMVIIDDASDDTTPEFLSTLDDARFRLLRVPHGGVCAARNAGLAEATGEIIAYLDDDNTLHPSWLKSVVWGFEQRPDVDVLYGAFVLDNPARVLGSGAGDLPRLFLRPYDREVLLRHNLADMSAIAHRAGLPGARFDESLVEMGDWDLLCRLTADRDPLVLPAIACFYTTDAPNRLSGGDTFYADYEAVRRKHSPEGTLP